MKISSLLIFILPFLLFSCAEKNAKEQASNDTISVTDTSKLFEVVPEQEKPKPNIDTIQAFAEDSSKLRVIIFSYYDTIPEKPLRKFKVVNEDDSVLFWSRDTMVEIQGEGIDMNIGSRDFLIISYKIDNISPLNISLYLHCYEDTNSIFGLISNYKNKIFDTFELRNNNFHLQTTVFLQSNNLQTKNSFTIKPARLTLEDIISYNEDVKTYSKFEVLLRPKLLREAYKMNYHQPSDFLDSIIKNVNYYSDNQDSEGFIKVLYYSLQ